MPTDWSLVLSELVKVAPQAVIIIIVILINNSMHKHNINSIKDTYDSAVENIREAYKDATEQLRENIKLLSEISSLHKDE